MTTFTPTRFQITVRPLSERAHVHTRPPRAGSSARLGERQLRLQEVRQMPEEDQELPGPDGQALRVVPHNGEESSCRLVTKCRLLAGSEGDLHHLI